MIGRLIQIYCLGLMGIWIGFLFWQKNNVLVYDNVNNASYHSVAQQLDTEANYSNTGKNEAYGIAESELSSNNENSIQDIASDYIKTQIDSSILESLYKESPSVDILLSLIDLLLSQHKFDKAYSYIQEAVKKHPGSIDPHTHIYGHLHSNNVIISQSRSILSWDELIRDYRNRNLINTDDYNFYQALIKLWDHDFAGAELLLQEIKSPRHQNIQEQILSIIDSSKKQRGMPEYYYHTLVSLVLTRNSYYNIAKRIAVQASIKNPKYILPQQILAYSHFVTHNRDVAIEYFLKLRDLEKKQEQRYVFLIGVSHYRNGNYTQAIMYLNQVRSPGLIMDASRYLFASYVKSRQRSRAHSTWNAMLGNISINKHDFYNYFYYLFYEPFRRGENFDMFENHNRMVLLSIQQCESLLREDDQDVCDYAKAGVMLAQGEMQASIDLLLELAERYQESYMLHAIGDYYKNIGQEIYAENYYKKAFDKSEHREERQVIEKKLLNMGR